MRNVRRVNECQRQLALFKRWMSEHFPVVLPVCGDSMFFATKKNNGSILKGAYMSATVDCFNVSVILAINGRWVECFGGDIHSSYIRRKIREGLRCVRSGGMA